MGPASSSAASSEPQIVIVMGVSGAGKSTVAEGLAAAMGWVMAEGDDFHSAANKQKMASGVPLTDEDRWPWLRSIGEWMDDRLRAGQSAVVTCSALRRSYRDFLRDGRPRVRFCELDAPEGLIAHRLQTRRGHYMPASLLPSQLATLEPLEPDEPGVRVSVAPSPQQIVRNAIAALHLDVEGTRS
jgi:gluconokinase